MSKNWTAEVEEQKSKIDFKKFRYGLRLETNKGAMNFDFFDELAPAHVSSLVALVRGGFYDGLSFHRVIPGFVIQGGCPSGNGTGGPGFRIPAEFSETPHEFGVLSMARAQDVNSAGSQFFVCLDKVPYLDRQYTVFGGMRKGDEETTKTIRSIADVPTGRGDVPVERISILRAEVQEVPR